MHSWFKHTEFIFKHQGEEQEHPESQQEAEGEQRAEEESAAGLKQISGTVLTGRSGAVLKIQPVGLCVSCVGGVM